MGLLNFITKKSSHSDLPRYGSLKTSAYNETVASRPPIRGTYPVLGNGAKILEEFQKSHPNLATISHNNTPTISAQAPLFRGPGVDRPRTAPTNQLRNASGLKSSQSQPLSLSQPAQKKKYGPYKLPPRLDTNVGGPSAFERPVPSPGLVSLYSNSVRSSEPGKPKGYVDLLDAQSMFKPLDFHSRVQAAGARNYGEDVADRNVVDCNRDMTSSPLEAARAQDTILSHASGYEPPSVSRDVDDDSNDEPPRPRRVRNSTISNRRPKSIGPHTPGSFPKRTSSRVPPHPMDETPKTMTRTESARSERAARRKSMPSYMASTAGQTPRSTSAVRKGKHNDVDAFPDSLKPHARSATAYDREYAKPNISSKRQSLVPSHDGFSTNLQRNDLDKPLPTLPTTSRNHSKRRTITTNTTVVESRLLEKRQSLQGMTSSSRGEIYEDTYQKKKSLQAAHSSRGQNSARHQLGSTTDLQDFFYSSPAQQPDHESQIVPPATHTATQDHLSRLDHLQNHSIISLPAKNVETGSVIPDRISSLRRWSQTSETAMSTLSSNPFRPQSGHTTNTSVDFSPLFPRAYINELIPPVPDISHIKSRETTSRNTSPIPSSTLPLPIPNDHQPDEFFLEDHASDGASSPIPSSGSYEKDLLFSDTGYGVSGDQISGLPGLFDVAMPASPVGSSNPNWGNEIQRVPRQFHMPAYIESDNDILENQYQEDSSSEDEMNFDIPMSRATSALRHTPVPEKLPAKTQQPLEEEEESDY
ncbi:hypothetical protein F5Y08DRAFT_49767 [Xylaria arbuscula]|nr:hypothetical protein F5Y08DRAFT_49767 [Xylaria arbuscula]